MGLADTLNIIILVVVLVIIIGIAAFVYQYYQRSPSNDTGNCSSSSPIGSSDGPQCPEGYQIYGGVCYVDRWTKFGGNKTAVCSVEYENCSGAGYGCTVDISQDLEPGTECNATTVPGWSQGEGYFVVNGYTTNYCAKGGTHDIWCDEGTEGGEPKICPADADFFEGFCIKVKCPEGTVRTEYCICQEPIS